MDKKGDNMNINKKIKCNHCQAIVESNGKCDCQKIILVENQLVSQAIVGLDYTDLSPKLLME